MPSVDDLSGYVQENDIKGFLLCYMQLVDEGLNLSVPTSLELPQVKEGWEQILPEITGGFSDEFVEQLSQFWLTTVTKQGAKVTPTFAKEIIAILENKPKPAAASAPPKQAPPAAPKAGIQPAGPKPAQGEAEPVSHVPAPGPALDTVASHISSTYYSYQSAKESPLLPKDQLNEAIKQALAHEQADDFLIHYLSLSRHKEKVTVPLSSVLETIMAKWEEILMSVYSVRPSLAFLKALSAKWFYAVQFKGLPMHPEALQDLLFFLVSNQSKNPKPELENIAAKAEVKQGFLKKITGIFK